MPPKEVTFYGLWSAARLSWWQDTAGLVFATVSPNVAAAQLHAVLTAGRRAATANNDWQVKVMAPGEPGQE